MKLFVPLPLKVSLWLLLNLLLLAAAGLAVSVSRGGAGWDVLVGGRAGDRLQAVGGVIASEVAEAPQERRDDILRRFGSAYGAQFYIFRNDGRELAGSAVQLPEAVAGRLQPWRGARPPRAEERPEDMDDAGPPPRAPGGPAASPGRGRFLVRTSQPSDFWMGIRVPFQEPDGELPTPATLIARADSVVAIARLLDWLPWILGGGAVLIFSVIFWLPFVRGVTRALAKLAEATGRIAEGQFTTRVHLRRRDELGRLGGAINLMAARLDTLVNGQKRFLGDVAHELCSPLGRLQVAMGILEQRADPSLAGMVADVREEVEEMSHLVDELLDFSKAGMRERNIPIPGVDLAATIQRAVMRESEKGRVTVDLPPGLHVLAVPDLLDRSIRNLVRNAVRYGGAGAITVVAREDGDWAEVTVSDEGPGVPAEALARLGEPFYRPELARTRESGGAGLGLAIVRSGIEACQGTLSLRNRIPRGFEAKIRLRREAR